MVRGEILHSAPWRIVLRVVRQESLRLAARQHRRQAEQATGRLLRRAGYEFRRSHFYLPFPDVDRLPDALWAGPKETIGVELNVSDAVALLPVLAPHFAEFEAAIPASSYYRPNGGYESVDADLLFALLRHLKPKRVIELGSGASSHVIAMARRAAGETFSHTIYDPYPFGNAMGPVEGAKVEAVATEKLDSAVVETLEPGDVFFVDTTHTVKTGGDVVRIFLELLPLVPVGVYVHVHDIFLPYEYPKAWVVEERRAWAEQYLLQAFLAFNDSYEVIFPAHAVSRAAPDEVAAAISSFGPGVAPGAFWMRRV